MTTTQPHKWAVTGQEEHPTMDEHGKPTVDHHIQFQTVSGIKSHVTIPDKHYSAENVHQAIEHKATEMEKVHHMHSDSRPTPPGEK